MNVNLFLLVILDYLKVQEDYITFESFLEDFYKEDFIHFFYQEYSKLTDQIELERTKNSKITSKQKLKTSKSEDLDFEYA